MTDVEPIKASTIKQFEWCPVEAFIDHLKEIGDERVVATSKSSEAIRAGEVLHDDTFGLRVVEKDEDTGREILNKMQRGQVTAINFGDYQIQGAPDNVIVEGNAVRITDLKTTGWDDRDFYLKHQLPPAAFQVRIYSWMLSHVPDITVKDPRIVVKRRENGTATEWFTEQVEYDREDTKQQIERVLSLFENPKELPQLRPEEDWKCSNDDHWDQFVNGVAFSD